MTGFFEGTEGAAAPIPHSLVSHDDVLVTSPLADGDVLKYDTTEAKWIPEQAGASVVADLDDLADVNVPSPLNQQVLTYNSTTLQWEGVSIAAGAPIAIDDLTDVVITGPVTQPNYLVWDTVTSKWTNQQPVLRGTIDNQAIRWNSSSVQWEPVPAILFNDGGQIVGVPNAGLTAFGGDLTLSSNDSSTLLGVNTTVKGSIIASLQYGDTYPCFTAQEDVTRIYWPGSTQLGIQLFESATPGAFFLNKSGEQIMYYDNNSFSLGYPKAGGLQALVVTSTRNRLNNPDGFASIVMDSGVTNLYNPAGTLSMISLQGSANYYYFASSNDEAIAIGTNYLQIYNKVGDLKLYVNSSGKLALSTMPTAPGALGELWCDLSDGRTIKLS